MQEAIIILILLVVGSYVHQTVFNNIIQMQCSLSTSSVVLLSEISYPEDPRPKMTQYLSDSLIHKKSLKASKAKDLFYQKKVKAQLFYNQSITLPFLTGLSSSKLNMSTLSNKKNSIKRKISQTKRTSFEKINNVYRPELNFTEHKKSKSRSNLCKSVLKKISVQLSPKEHDVQRKIYTEGCEAINLNFKFFNDQVRALKEERKSRELKYNVSLEVHTKIENERMLRLLQRQEQLEQKYSKLKFNLKKHMQKNASKKLSKRDYFIYSKSLDPNHLNSLQQKKQSFLLKTKQNY